MAISKFEDHLWREFVREHANALVRMSAPTVKHTWGRAAAGRRHQPRPRRRWRGGGARARHDDHLAGVRGDPQPRRHGHDLDPAPQRHRWCEREAAPARDQGNCDAAGARRLPAHGLGVRGGDRERPLEDRSQHSPRRSSARTHAAPPDPRLAATVGTAAPVARCGAAERRGPSWVTAVLPRRAIAATPVTAATASAAAPAARCGAAERRDPSRVTAVRPPPPSGNSGNSGNGRSSVG